MHSELLPLQKIHNKRGSWPPDSERKWMPDRKNLWADRYSPKRLFRPIHQILYQRYNSFYTNNRKHPSGSNGYLFYIRRKLIIYLHPITHEDGLRHITKPIAGRRDLAVTAQT